jgi:hypothetical protein
MIYLTFLIGSLALSLILFVAGTVLLIAARNKVIGFLSLAAGTLLTFFPLAIYLTLTGMPLAQ